MGNKKAQIAAAIMRLALPLTSGLAFLIAIYIRFYSGLISIHDRPLWPAYIAYFVLFGSVWSVLDARFDVAELCLCAPSMRSWAWSLVQMDLLTLALISCAAFFWRAYSFSRLAIAVFWCVHILLCMLAAFAVRFWLRHAVESSSVCLLMVGDHVSLEQVTRECLAGRRAVLAGRFADSKSMLEALDGFEAPADCSELLVVLCADGTCDLPGLARALERQAIPASIAVRDFPIGSARVTQSFVVMSAGAAVPGAFDYVLSKRLVDLILAGLALLVLAPAMAAVAAVTYLRSGRPVLLAQERVGCGGRRFQLYKFRTLPVSALASSGIEWNSRAADAWGRFLRATGIDELPQLWNVLRGNMSLVGPRPERPHFVEQFRRQLPFYATRHRLQAGITGWAQVNGWRGDTSISNRVECDLYYLRHWSLAFDFRILWMTFRDFLRRLWGFAGESTGAANARSV